MNFSSLLNNITAVVLYYSTAFPAVPYFILAWSLLWKGLALWKAAKCDQRNWFIAMLIINGVGILELIYLFYFAKDRMKIQDLKFWENK